jgi:hypothetical protein
MRYESQEKFFHGDKEVGFIDRNGQIKDAKNQEGIERIIEVLPLFLRNALPEGERYENLLLNSPHPISSPIDAAKNVDELPGNFSIGAPQSRAYVPFPHISGEKVHATTTLPESMFFANSEIRIRQKPSFSGYQDKFVAKVALVAGELVISQVDSEKEVGNVIIKPGIKFPGVAQNEFVCMRLAEKAGIEIPRTFLLKHPGNKLSAWHLCVERFDFTADPPFEKKNMLEFASLMNLDSKSKYSAQTEELFQCAEKYLGVSDLRKLGRAYFYGILTGNGDMHTKNFSVFIDTDGSYRLTPIYDMVNTQVHGFPDMLALPMNESCNPNPSMRSVIDFFENYISKDEMHQMAQTIEQSLPSVLTLAFPQEDRQDGSMNPRRVSFRQRLEESILVRVLEAKMAIEKKKGGKTQYLLKNQIPGKERR